MVQRHHPPYKLLGALSSTTITLCAAAPPVRVRDHPPYAPYAPCAAGKASKASGARTSSGSRGPSERPGTRPAQEARPRGPIKERDRETGSQHPVGRPGKGARSRNPESRQMARDRSAGGRWPRVASLARQSWGGGCWSQWGCPYQGWCAQVELVQQAGCAPRALSGAKVRKPPEVRSWLRRPGVAPVVGPADVPPTPRTQRLAHPLLLGRSSDATLSRRPGVRGAAQQCARQTVRAGEQAAQENKGWEQP